MSFDIFFQPGRFGGKPVKQKNPFTGEEQSVVPNEPLTLAELKAVRAVLKKAGAKEPDDFGCYVVKVADGGEAEVFGEKLAEGCMVALRGLTPGLVTFLMDLLKAGNWVMLPAMEGNPAITASPDHLKGIPKDFPEVITCTSADSLGVLLSGGFGAWKNYRDQVVRGAGKKDKKQR
jgi:hypothetical protein